MAARAIELCAAYCPEKTLNASQLRHLMESIAANALIGRDKSAVLVHIDSKLGKKDFRRIIIHELMHIFCAKLEMGAEHFIDVYGSGTTPEAGRDDKVYDGIIVAGYSVWSEFIAQYYAVRLIDQESIDFSRIAGFITRLFGDVSISNLEGSRGAFAMICAYWFNCADFYEAYAALREPGAFMHAEEPHGNDAQKALRGCIEYLHIQMAKDRPWEISVDFIFGLGFQFSMFRTANSFYIAG